MSNSTIFPLPFSLNFILLTLLVFSSGTFHGAFPSAQSTSRQPSSFEEKKLDKLVHTVHQEVNAFRESRGLPPLTINPLISAAASAHSQAMAQGRVSLSHAGFEQRVDKLKEHFTIRKAAENVGINAGYADPARTIVQEWVKSPGHAANIKGDFGITGIGVAQAESGEYYFTQIFLKE